MANMSGPPGRNYRYKSVGILILQVAGLRMILDIGRKFLSHLGSNQRQSWVPNTLKLMVRMQFNNSEFAINKE